MNLLMKNLELEQQLWLAQLAIQVIWCDGDLSKEEFEAFHQLTAPLGDAVQINKLTKQLETPENTTPYILDSIPKKLLPHVFQELVALAICDWDLNSDEEVFLAKIGNLFQLSLEYQKSVVQWAKEGVAWHQDIRNILPTGMSFKKYKMPLHELTDTQRIWYANSLITIFMGAEAMGKEEAKLIEKVIRSIEEEGQRERLLALIKNNLPSHLSPPKDLQESELFLALIEMIIVLSQKTKLSHRQINLIADYVHLCQLPTKSATLALEWCKDGIRWGQAAAMVIKKGRFSSDKGSSLAKSEDRWLPVRENNSLHYREQSCFVCGSVKPIKIYRLAPRTQKVTTNIFGITAYRGSLGPDYDEIDFHHVAVNLCPECLFASRKKELFQTKTGSKAPAIFQNGKFKQSWMSSIENREKLFASLEFDQSQLPSISQVILRHQLEIHCAIELEKQIESEARKWEIANLHLILAEVLMSAGQSDLSEKELEKAVVIAEKMMEKTWDTSLGLRAARLLLNFAIYSSNGKVAGEQLNFFIQMKDEKFESFAPEEKTLFKGIYAGIKKNFDDRESLSKKNLNGFHKKVFELIKEEDTKEEDTDASQ